jgi:GNAT superfamily N-acetyltransferase
MFRPQVEGPTMAGAIRLSPGKDEKKVKEAFDEIAGKLVHIGGPFFYVEYGDGLVTLELKPTFGKLRLSLIAVPEEHRGKGLASRALRMLTEVADKHGVEISLDAAPQEGGSLTKKELFQWYGRHGFKRLPYTMERKLSDMMVRKPEGKVAAGELLKMAKELLGRR